MGTKNKLYQTNCPSYARNIQAETNASLIVPP